MDEMLREINKYPNGTVLIIKWKNNLMLKGEIDTIYETDNGLEMDSDDYIEFYACSVKVLEILSSPIEGTELVVDSLIEISMQNSPSEIMLENDVVVWRI
ncbi:hypothetical protein EDX87_00865 [Listeria monocytogenes]|uniref:Uncharacterized protein n=1 Tax=Listeria monocytogenes TaxID=1639 RepID=A0A5Y9DMT2_LISMN|nr:hypothetical protein [Listeria monocytogenes]EAD0694743.1 hypothetical protein [Listeria monocytogenes]EAH4074425.1 hypothetical protein [Listeria monocytogenes]EAK9792008.1 hypothetical protein [Listeria monocytogenes]EBF5145184.1 hypothetical protein [Listeria monocytogenes]ECQ6723552.1 hypothetical protein [Listeria monocytogenes]